MTATFLTLISTSFAVTPTSAATTAAARAVAIVNCNQSQAQLLLKLNSATSQFILPKSQRLVAFISTTEKAAIGQCLYTSDADFNIRYFAEKGRKVALRVMGFSPNIGWNQYKRNVLDLQVASCIKTCTPVQGAPAAQLNCGSMTANYDAIMNLSPGELSGCDLTLGSTEQN